MCRTGADTVHPSPSAISTKLSTKKPRYLKTPNRPRLTTSDTTSSALRRAAWVLRDICSATSKSTAVEKMIRLRKRQSHAP